MAPTDPIALGTTLGTLAAAAFAAFNARRTQKSVQPNGESLAELLGRLADLLGRLAALEEYSHTRFHDVLNSQEVSNSLVWEIARKLDLPLPPYPSRTPVAPPIGAPSTSSS